MRLQVSNEDPFPDVVDDIPEVASHELSADLLRGAIAHHGALLVRGLIDLRCVDALAVATARAFEAREHSGDGNARTVTQPWYVPCAAWDDLSRGKSHAVRNIARHCNAVQLVDAPRALARVVEAFDAVDLSGLVAECLDEPVSWSVDKTTLRRVTREAGISWHQDGAFTAPSCRAVTVWVALGDCGPGTGAPGIAIVPRRVNTLLTPGGPGAPMTMTLSVADAERVGGGITAAPTFGPGDALLFDERTVHTTDGANPDWTHPRYAITAWAFASSTFPEKFVPLEM
jgi:ectoine hydroxylase-related dioxygenase (phytanoyl-CoA dioxygenase family)